MRILHVASTFARRFGGPSEVLRGLIPAQRELGVHVELATTDRGIDQTDQIFSVDTGVHVFPSMRPQSWTFSPAMALEIARLVKTFDVVHIHSLQTFPSTIAMIAARTARVPYVVQPHGALDRYHWAQGRFKKSAYLNLVDRYGVRGLSGALFSSEQEATQGREILRDTPVFALPLGVDPDLQVIEGTRESVDVFEILFLGRVTAKKRLDIVIAALAESGLCDQDTRLVVAGPIDNDLPYDPRILASTLGVLDRVTFLGQVDAETRKALLRRASVFVLPSEDESFGVAVAEAMSTGCAVVTTAQVGIAPEAARNGALKIASPNAFSFAQAIFRLKTDDAARIKMGHTAREFAIKRYSWPIAAKAAITCYEQIMGS